MEQETTREFEGMFWLPETPDRQVRGKLRIAPGSEITLRLEDHVIERSEDPSDAFQMRGGDYDVICGDTFDHNRICLIDVITTSMHDVLFGSGPQIKEEVFAHRALLGTYEPDPELTSMTLTTPNLVDFIDGRLRPFSVENFGDPDGMTIGWSRPDTALDFEAGEISLTLKPGYDASIGPGRAVLENSALIKSSSLEGQPLSAHERTCQSLKHLIEFFSQRPTSRAQWTGTTSCERRVEVFKLELDVREKGKHEWLARQHVADRFEVAFTKWMELQELDAILCGALRDLVNGVGDTPERALGALRFVERFEAIKLEQAGQPDDTYFRSRYKSALERFGDLFDPLLGNPDLPHDDRVSKFTETARDTRVLFAHLAIDGPEVLLEGRDQHYMYERAWLLARACILDFLGFTQEEIREFITRDRQFDHVARQPLRTDR